ncbi:unnamed protein product, partial [Dibothriocephalus latus]
FGDANLRAFLAIGACQHGRKDEIEEGEGESANLLNSVDYGECFLDCPCVSDASHRPVVWLIHHERESPRRSEFPHGLPESIAMNPIEDTPRVDEEFAKRFPLYNIPHLIVDLVVQFEIQRAL